jgi:hypothetical protein
VRPTPSSRLLFNVVIFCSQEDRHGGPPYSSNPSPSYDTVEDMVKDYMEAIGTDYETSGRKVRVLRAPRLPVPLLMFDQALARYGFQCVITGWFDGTSLDECVELRSKQEHLGRMHTIVRPTHILNGSATQDTQTDHTTGVITILENFGFESLVRDLKEIGGINKVWNLVPLRSDLHISFGGLDLWFEGTSEVRCSGIFH